MMALNSEAQGSDESGDTNMVLSSLLGGELVAVGQLLARKIARATDRAELEVLAVLGEAQGTSTQYDMNFTDKKQ